MFERKQKPIRISCRVDISVYILFQMVRNHDIVPFGEVGLTVVFRYKNQIK